MPGAKISKPVQRAFDATGSDAADVGVDHGCLQVGMSQEFLDGANIFAGLEEVSREAVPKGVARDLFGDSATPSGGGDGGLDGRFMDVMTPELAAVGGRNLKIIGVAGSGFTRMRILGDFEGGENVLPVEGATELGIFGGERVGEPDPTGSVSEVLMVELAGEFDLRLEFGDERLGEGDVAVFASLSFADDDLFAGEVEVFDAESARFH